MEFDINSLSSVIDISKDYDDICEFSLYKSKDTGEIQILPRKKRIEGYPKSIKTLNGVFIPYFFGSTFPDKTVPKKYLNLWRKKVYASYFISRFLYGKHKTEIEENVLIPKLEKILALNKNEIKILLKLLIAHEEIIVDVQKLKSKPYKYYFLPTQKHREKRQKKLFLSSIIDELLNKSERVNLLINHPGSIGSYREDLLINVLKKYIPKKFSISSGFIENIPRQIDIIIYDSHNFIPLFNENNIVVVKPESVRAIIEVKSTLYTKELNLALELLHDISNHITPVIPIFKGIFAFDSKYVKHESIAKNIINFYINDQYEGVWKNNLTYQFQSIDCICVPNKFFLFSSQIDDSVSTNHRIRPNINAISKKQFGINAEGALFLERLFSFLDVEITPRKINLDYFFALSDETDFDCLGYLATEDWLSNKFSHYVGSRSLENFDDFKKRNNDIVKWINGELTSNELYSIYNT